MMVSTVPIPETGFHAMARTLKERTRQRCVMTTDSEWEMIGALAGRVGMSNSRFLVERALEPREPPPEAPSGFPPEVRRRMALAMLVLARVEERRMDVAGANSIWDDIVAGESAWLDAELALEGA